MRAPRGDPSSLARRSRGSRCGSFRSMAISARIRFPSSANKHPAAPDKHPGPLPSSPPPQNQRPFDKRSSNPRGARETRIDDRPCPSSTGSVRNGGKDARTPEKSRLSNGMAKEVSCRRRGSFSPNRKGCRSGARMSCSARDDCVRAGGCHWFLLQSAGINQPAWWFRDGPCQRLLGKDGGRGSRCGRFRTGRRHTGARCTLPDQRR